MARQVSEETERNLERGVTLENGAVFKTDTASMVRLLGMSFMAFMAKMEGKSADIPGFRTAAGDKKNLSGDEVLALAGEVFTKAGGLIEASATKQGAIMAAKTEKAALAAFGK